MRLIRVVPHHPFDVIVSCEHASNAVPPELDLGVPEDVLDSHVAWDPGAKPVADLLARELKAPLFLGQYTRLVADLNRSPWNPEIVPTVAFDCPVPANQGLDHDGRKARVARYHAPYWNDVKDEIQHTLDAHPQSCVLHLSIHSFTGEFRGEVRPMSLGIMVDPILRLERHVCDVLLEELNGRGVHAVENQPYDGRADALVTTMRPLFGEDRYAGIEIELSQNHLDEIDALGHRLLEAVRALKLKG